MKLAQVHAFFAWYVAGGKAQNESPEPVIVKAIEHAENAARRNPDEPMARYVVASLWRTRALYASDRGLDAMPLVDRAVEYYEQAIGLDSAFVWALNELCSSLSMRGRQQTLRGVDPSATFARAMTACEQASTIEPTFVFPRMSQVAIHKRAAEFAVAMGRAPDEHIRAAEEALRVLVEKTPRYGNLGYWNAGIRRIEAASAMDRGKDPIEMLQRAEESTRQVEQNRPQSNDARQLRGELALLQAHWQLKQGQDPEKSVQQAREALRYVVEANPWDVGYRVWSAQAEILSLRWAMRRDERIEAERYAVARAILTPLVDMERVEPQFYQALAEIDELEALEMVRLGKDPNPLRAQALSWIEKTLALNPVFKSALDCKKRLLDMETK
jgi:tetratricopeptide (TPR) repeat protein